MVTDPKIPYCYSHLVDFSNGVDSAKAADLLANGFTSFATNVTFRNGKPTTRPQFSEVVLPEQPLLAEFSKRKFQGDAIYQEPTSDTSYYISVRGGYVYKLDLSSLQLTCLNPADKLDHTRRHYFCQADKYLVIQNGIDIPFIYDGTTIWRSRCQTNNPGIKNLTFVNDQGVATITTDGNHGFVAGDYVMVDNTTPPAYVGTYQIQTVPTTSSYTINVIPTDGADASPAGYTYYPMEVPIGLYMEYAMGRLVVVSPDRKTLRIGDIIRATPDTADVNSVTWFTEEMFLAENFVFALPAAQGRIRAVQAIPFLGAPTGQGDIVISGDRGMSTLNLSLPRGDWMSSPIQKIALSGVAIASHTGIVGYNGDLLFRDLEFGIRSFRLGVLDSGKNPGQTPISAEMNRIFLSDDQDKLQFTSMMVFDNRLLTTCTPVFDERRVPVVSIVGIGTDQTITFDEAVSFSPGDKIKAHGTTLPEDTDLTITEVISTTVIKVTATGTNQGAVGFIYGPKTGVEYYHRGLAALDYTNLSKAQNDVIPTWEGLWTGLQPQSITKAQIDGIPRCFVAHFNPVTYSNELWEVLKTQGPDVSASGDVYFPSTLELPSMDCLGPQGTGGPFNLKKLWGLQFHILNLLGNSSATIYYRNDGETCWNLWAQSTADDGTPQSSIDLCAVALTEPTSETSPNSVGYQQALPQHRVVKMGQPAFFECEVTTNRDARLFYKTQLKIEWTGILTWDKIRLMAIEQLENTRGGCW